MHECLLTQALPTPVVLLHHIVDLTDRRADQERHDEGEDVPMSSPEEDVDRVEKAEKGETPLDGVDDDLFPSGGELEDHRAKEEEVDEGPYVESIVRWCDVCRWKCQQDVEAEEDSAHSSPNRIRPQGQRRSRRSIRARGRRR